MAARRAAVGGLKTWKRIMAERLQFRAERTPQSTVWREVYETVEERVVVRTYSFTKVRETYLVN